MSQLDWVDDAWTTIENVQDAVRRCRDADSTDELWRRVADNWHSVMDSPRMAILLQVSPMVYDVVQRTEYGTRVGAYPDRVDLEDTPLQGVSRCERPTWVSVPGAPDRRGFPGWVLGHADATVLAVPLEASGETVGLLLTVVGDAGNRRCATTMATVFGTQIAMTWHILRMRDERMRSQEFRQTTHALHQARFHTASAGRAKSTFLANMSHELRTPLNAIIGYAELLAEENLFSAEPDASEDIERIRQSAAHLLGLISDVLDLSRVEAGRIRVGDTAVAVAELIHELLPEVDALLEANHNRLAVHVDPRAGRVLGDRARLRQVLLNLLSNACRFTQQGSIEVRAEPWVHGGRPGVLFQVVDTGIGMDADQLAHVFDPFEQAHRVSVDGRQGTGVGLAISRHLARMMGATLEIVSEPGRGTEAQLWVPAPG